MMRSHCIVSYAMKLAMHVWLQFHRDLKRNLRCQEVGIIFSGNLGSKVTGSQLEFVAFRSLAP